MIPPTWYLALWIHLPLFNNKVFAQFVIHTAVKIPMLDEMGARYVIAAGHPLTADAARHALDSGGNAFDGLLAGWLASCVAEPVLTSPGGGGFAMVAPATGRPRLYDFFAQTPIVASPDAHSFPVKADFGSTQQVFHLGAGTIATPGCVAGLLQLHDEFGSIPFAECAAPARQYAKEGITITPHAATLLEVVNDLYQATAESQRLFQSAYNPGACLGEGEVFRNPDFCHFLDMLETEGSRWFYRGDIGRIIGAYCETNGGHLRRKDFESYQVHVREPLRIERRGAAVWLNPPPSMGGTLVAFGLLMGGTLDSTPYPHLRREGWLDWIRPLRMMSEMRTCEGLERLPDTDKQAIGSASQAFPQLQEAMASLFPHARGHIQTHGTTQLSIMDKAGNEIAMTTSNGSGSAVIPAGTGFMLNNMLGEEDLQPDGLNTWKVDRRLASMMCPSIVHNSDGSRLATGSGGSNRIRSTILQVLRHVIDGKLSIEDAIAAPRLHWEAGELHAETEAASVLSSLDEPVSYPVIEHVLPNLFFGGAHTVGVDARGQLHGQGDPRRGGVSIVN